MDMLRDTHPDAERVQLEVLRRAGPAGRYRLLCQLTDEVIDLSWRNLRAAHRADDGETVRLRFLEACYGAELAAAVARRLGRP
jgi:hypothetical protein